MHAAALTVIRNAQRHRLSVVNALLSMPGLPHAAIREQPFKPRVVGKYGPCHFALDASDEGMRSWKRRFTQQHLSGAHTRCGSSFCNLHENLYLYDRCWNPRAICTLLLGGARNRNSTFVIAQRSPENPPRRELHSSDYVTVLGPAAALGVGSPLSFAELLRKQLKRPVINLGRGGAGPSLYLRAEGEHVTELIAQSRVVIIVLMAGRSSANSAFPRA